MRGLKELRKNRGLSQSELAARAGVTQMVVSVLETYDVEPRGELREAIENALCEKKERVSTMTQTNRVLNYMIDHGSITQKDAINEFGCYRLAAKIFDLRKEGYVIETERKPFRNEYTSGFYAKYKLVGGKP